MPEQIVEETLENVYEVVIVGSGPAGYTAGIYAARAALNPVIIAGAYTPGGALMTTSEVENFPGFPQGIQGPELMDNMREQAEKFGAKVLYADVVEVELTDAIKKVVTDDGEEFLAKTVILATGSQAKKLGLDDEEKYSGKGVSYCATCDGAFFAGKDLIVVGGGDSAMEEATFLTRYAEKVTVVYRRSLEDMPASEIMKNRAMANPKIEFIFNSEIVAINGENLMESATVRNKITAEEQIVKANGLFVAIGHTPRTQMLQGQVELDSAGYIKTQEPYSYTSQKGVFACGDVVDHHYQQAITAAAMGCKAAIDAEKYLAENF